MRQDLRQAAAEHLAGRRARDAAFGEARAGFGEPAWDMLLHLTTLGGEADNDELVGASGTSAAVAERYITWLVSRGLVTRDRIATDQHRFVVRLQAHAEALLVHSFSAGP